MRFVRRDERQTFAPSDLDTLSETSTVSVRDDRSSNAAAEQTLRNAREKSAQAEKALLESKVSLLLCEACHGFGLRKHLPFISPECVP